MNEGHKQNPQDAKKLLTIYEKLSAHFGRQDWWPAGSDFEMIVGAVLTQNTNWRNVEKALEQLKKAGALKLTTMNKLPETELATLIRSSGFFRLKEARLRAFLNLLYSDFEGSLNQLFALPQDKLRKTLLGLKGFGPETVDSILLYAAKKPSFVIDAYTRRIFSRHTLVKKEAKYDILQRFFIENLPNEVDLFGEYHALIVQTAKGYCKTTASCEGCPLRNLEGFQPHDKIQAS